MFALALAMKLIVPAGFMPTISDGRFIVTVCTGTGPMSMAMPGLDHGKSEAPCAFAGLAAPSLAAADAVLLAAAIVFVVALGVQPIGPRKTPDVPHLRPYLRGPPAA